MRSREISSRMTKGLIAALFLFFLLAEWGSHGVICAAYHGSDNAPSAASAPIDHEDPCDTLVVCSDSRGRERRAPSFNHDAMQHNGLMDVIREIAANVKVTRDPRLAPSNVKGLSRPPDLPFNPPELS